MTVKNRTVPRGSTLALAVTMDQSGKCIASPAALLEGARLELAGLATLVAGTEPGHSVHGARRRIKQLRSQLRLMRASLGEDCCSRCALREAAHALAGHRKAEALKAAAEKLGGGTGSSFWPSVAGAYHDIHAAAGDQGTALAAAAAAIGRAAALMDAAQAPSAGEAETLKAFRQCYGKARRLLARSLRTGEAEDLHEARKFVIHHLHHLKLLYPGRQGRLAALERLREALGDLNDLDELEQLAVGLSIPAPEEKRMRKARRRLIGEASRAAERLFRRKPGPFARRMAGAAKLRSHSAPVALQAGE